MKHYLIDEPTLVYVHDIVCTYYEDHPTSVQAHQVLRILTHVWAEPPHSITINTADLPRVSFKPTEPVPQWLNRWDPP